MKVKDKEVQGVQYFKYRINLPTKLVRELRWEGKELKVIQSNGKLVIQKEQNP